MHCIGVWIYLLLYSHLCNALKTLSPPFWRLYVCSIYAGTRKASAKATVAMLATKFYKNCSQKSLRNLNSFTRSKTIKSLSNNVSCTRTKLLRNLSPNLSQCRNSSGETQNEITFPTLSDDQKLFLPNIFRSISNFVKLHLVIKGKLDKDFKLQQFLDGSKQVSCKT